MEVVVTTGAMRYAKLQSNCHHRQTNTLSTGRMPFLSPNKQCHSTEWKNKTTTQKYYSVNKCQFVFTVWLGSIAAGWARLAINRSLSSNSLGKLLTHMCLCHQAV